MNGYLIAREKHQDGNDHFHVYLVLADAIKSRNPRLFDLGDNHPNIQTVRSDKFVALYCSKEDDYLTDIDLEILKKEDKHKSNR